MLLRLLTKYAIGTVIKASYWSVVFGFLYWFPPSTQQSSATHTNNDNYIYVTTICFKLFVAVLFYMFVPATVLIGLKFGALVNPAVISRLFFVADYLIKYFR